MRNFHHASGVTSTVSGQQFIGVSDDNVTAWLPRSVFVHGAKAGIPALTDRGIHVVGKEATDALMNSISDVTEFPLGHVYETPGWNADKFALPDGTVISASSGEVPRIAFPVLADICHVAGDLETWKIKVAKKMAARPLGQLVLAIAFTAPLMRFMPRVSGFMFELVGESSVGKSTLVQIMASVIGGVQETNRPAYWTSLTSASGDLDRLMGLRKDLPLILDQADRLFASGDAKTLTNAYLALAHPPSSNAPITGLVAGQSRSHWGMGILATGKSLRTAIKAPTEDGLISLQVPAGWEFGTKGNLPNKMTNSADFLHEVVTAAVANHGRPYRHFLEQLVVDLQSDPDRLIKRLARSQERFLDEAKIDRNDHVRLKVARVFAGIYAAEQLAIRYGALYRFQQPLSNLVKSMEMLTASPTPAIPFRQRVEALMQDPRVFTPSAKAKGTEMQTKLASDALGTNRITATYRELRIQPDRVHEAFSDWDQIKSSDEVQAVLRRDGAHLTVKAHLAPALPLQRLYCFRLPIVEESMFEQSETE